MNHLRKFRAATKQCPVTSSSSPHCDVLRPASLCWLVGVQSQSVTVTSSLGGPGRPSNKSGTKLYHHPHHPHHPHPQPRTWRLNNISDHYKLGSNLLFLTVLRVQNTRANCRRKQLLQIMISMISSIKYTALKLYKWNKWTTDRKAFQYHPMFIFLCFHHYELLPIKTIVWSISQNFGELPNQHKE